MIFSQDEVSGRAFYYTESPKGQYSQVSGLDMDRTLESVCTDEAIDRLSSIFQVL